MDAIIEWVLAVAEEFGVWGLMLLTLLDSFISPIPPEVLFIPLSLIDPSGAFWLAFVTTITSVIGALIGYWLGLKGGKPLVRKIFSESKLAKAEGIIQVHGVMAVLMASFTPIPFKLITVSSGALGLSLKKLVFWSTLGRGARFFLVAAIITFYGQSAKAFLESGPFALLTLGIGLLGIVIYLVRWYRNKGAKNENRGHN